MLKTGLLLTGGNASSALLGLLRNIIIARLLSVEDFGIASTFATMMALIENLSYIGLNRLIVQADDGDDPKLLATAQAVQLLRGLAGAAILFLSAGLLAQLFSVPHIAWAYQVLAALPLLRAFAPVDMLRMQRSMRFLPSVSADVLSQLAALAASVSLALWLKDFRAMLFAMLVQQAAYVAVAFMHAEQPYRLALDPAFLRRAADFGWPLLLNAVLMFAIFHGDRIVVGSVIGLTELGWFAAALTLTLMPAMLAANTMQSFMLPILSRARGDDAAFMRLYRVTVEACIFIGGAQALAFLLAGPMLLTLVFGAKYAPAIPVLLLLAAAQAARIAKAGTAIVAIASAETQNPMYANLLRAASLPLAWLAARAGAGLSAIVLIATLAELFSLALSLHLLQRRLALPLAPLAAPLATGGLALAFVLGVPHIAWFAGLDLRIELAVSAVILLLMVIAMPALRDFLRSGLSAAARPTA